jgi:hypothetical protein
MGINSLIAIFISAPWEIAVTNDTAVFEATRFDLATGEREWIGRMGTREAIVRDGLVVDAASVAYCPHEWIDTRGYVDLALVRRFSLMLAF